MFTIYFNAVRSLLRVPTYLLLVLYYTIAYIASRGPGSLVAYVVGAVAIAAWYVNATSLNDLSDFEIDKINLAGDPDRPLVTGELTKRQLQKIGAGSAILTLLLVAYFGWLAVALIAAMLALNAAYSLPPAAISRRGGLALALLPVGYVILSMLLGAFAAGIAPDNWLKSLVAICYIQFIARISLKDYRDVEGDAKFGKRTFLLRHGSRAVVRLAVICHLAAGIAGAVWLYFESPAIGAGYVFLATIAVTFLGRLSSAAGWATQRVWITAYGRLVSGQLAVILLDVLIRAGAISGRPQQYFLLVLVVGTFTWSSQRVVGQIHG